MKLKAPTRLLPRPRSSTPAGRSPPARTLPSLGGILLDGRGRRADAARDRHGDGLALTRRARRRGRARRAASCCRAGCWPTSPAACRRATSTLERRTEQRDVELTAGDARFHLRLLDAEDFPRLPEVGGRAATMPAAPLAETVDRVARAASRDEVRPILTGIMVSVEGVDPDDGRHRLLPARRSSAPSSRRRWPGRSRRTCRRGRCASCAPVVSRTGSRAVEIACSATRSSSGSTASRSRRG